MVIVIIIATTENFTLIVNTMDEQLKHIKDILIEIKDLMESGSYEEAEQEVYDLLNYVETGKHENRRLD